MMTKKPHKCAPYSYAAHIVCNAKMPQDDGECNHGVGVTRPPFCVSKRHVNLYTRNHHHVEISQGAWSVIRNWENGETLLQAPETHREWCVDLTLTNHTALLSFIALLRKRCRDTAAAVLVWNIWGFSWANREPPGRRKKARKEKSRRKPTETLSDTKNKFSLVSNPADDECLTGWWGKGSLSKTAKSLFYLALFGGLS